MNLPFAEREQWAVCPEVFYVQEVVFTRQLTSHTFYGQKTNQGQAVFVAILEHIL
tara:strand:- start:441 stop:605 length:165 start_codon:yes stop_codon:yes gene_type:complete